jgi:hypothetical protein
MFSSLYFRARHWAAYYWRRAGRFRLLSLHVMSYSGGPQAVRSYAGGAGDRIQAYVGGPVHVTVADGEE